MPNFNPPPFTNKWINGSGDVIKWKLCQSLLLFLFVLILFFLHFQFFPCLILYLVPSLMKMTFKEIPKWIFMLLLIFSYSTFFCVVSENITVNVAVHFPFAEIMSKPGNIISCIADGCTVLCLLNLGLWCFNLCLNFSFYLQGYNVLSYF